ncbi:acyl-CoA dehydrogenase family protein [Streptomyces sp. NPDC056949]|uniref:acyl-CoA dehydrogenase family protein n=1 Tax=Streptomyces sp. NPDC056949 TaxID=3345976 RepID=UPI0036406D50
MGVAGLAIPEDYGGAGYGAQEVHVVMEELGRVLSPRSLPRLGCAHHAGPAGRLVTRKHANACCHRLQPDRCWGPWPGPSRELGTPTRSELRLSLSPAGPGASPEPRSTSWTERMPHSCADSYVLVEAARSAAMGAAFAAANPLTPTSPDTGASWRCCR